MKLRVKNINLLKITKGEIMEQYVDLYDRLTEAINSL